MLEFICCFLPGLLAIAMADTFVKREKSVPRGWQSFLLQYGVYTLFINLGTLLYFTWAHGYVEEVLSKYSFTVAFSIEYLLVAIVLSAVLSMLFELVRSNLRISLYVRKRLVQTDSGEEVAATTTSKDGLENE